MSRNPPGQKAQSDRLLRIDLLQVSLYSSVNATRVASAPILLTRILVGCRVEYNSQV